MNHRIVTAAQMKAIEQAGNVHGLPYHLPSKQLQSRMAYKSGMNFKGKPMHFGLVDDWGYPIPQDELYVPRFRTNCATCGSRLICNGCSNCGKCL